jgi:predicted nucleic acid-binding protein
VEKDRIYVLDTSAIFCLKDDEAGSDKVEAILEAARLKHCRAYISFMSAMEYLYINFIRYGEEAGHKAYLEMTLLPLEIIESDEDLRLIAAEMKASHDISLADSWIAATAKKITPFSSIGTRNLNH